AMNALLARAGRVLVLTEPPVAPQDATRQSLLVRSGAPVFEGTEDQRKRRSATELTRRFQHSRLEAVEVADLFLKADGSVKLTNADGALLYQDARHLSTAGTALFRARLESLLR